MSIRIAALMLLIGSSVCIASDRELALVPTATQYLEYQKGVPNVYSDGPHTWVSLSVELESKKEAELWIGVGNRQAVSITVSGEGVSATSNDKPLRILGIAELEKKATRQAMWENIALGAATGANSYTASQQGRTTSTSTHSGTINNKYGGNSKLEYRGTTTTQTDDPVTRRRAQEEANAKSADMIAGAQANQATRASVIEDYVFRTQTVQPGDIHAGFLKLKLPKSIRSQSIPIEISVVAGIDTHRFFLFLDVPPTQKQRDAIQLIGASVVPANGEPGNEIDMGIWPDRVREMFQKWCIGTTIRETEHLVVENLDLRLYCRCLVDGIQKVASVDQFKATQSAETSEEIAALPYFWDVMGTYKNCKEQFSIP